jgi:hypothetical protein
MKIQIQRFLCGGLSAVWGVALTFSGSNSAIAAPATKTAVLSRATPKKPVKTDHDALIRAAIGRFFPGARLVAKPFPFDVAIAARMSRKSGVKFSGKDGHWQVFAATKNGQRVGMGVMTHSALPNGKDMHIAFAVNPRFAVIGVTPLDAPNNAKMRAVVGQMKGKTSKAAFKVGKDLKVVKGMPQNIAQIGADAVRKGLVILDENFNQQHGADEAARAAGAPHIEGDGHKH